jgi:hypothetical protein
MLCLQGGEVELISERGVELRCAASDLIVQVTGLSNLKLGVDDGSFVLSSVGGRAVPLPLASLESRLRSFRAAHPECPKESFIDPVSQWQKLLTAAGARSRGRTHSRLHLLWGVSVGALVTVFGSLGLLIAYAATP